jgi:transposase
MNHHKKAVREWPRQLRRFVKFHFLPPYSPDLNPVEPIWKKTKRLATHNRYFPELGLLHRAVFRRFNRFQGNPASLRGIIAPYV